ncbi:asparaginase [Gemmobacter caeruleus]|uniref:asparaginase n=1 Tax=Gemmobacter caeruleus TaxID=2595004 RepID=UPI0011EC5F1A|nr:asparaginase [Gemmobacter caeruleus]
MVNAVPMAGLWRGGMLESTHLGHAVICDAAGEIVEAWGNPDRVIFPRSSCKMLQALPLVESGAADAAGLTEAQLALSCASHQGAALHVTAVRDWLETLGLAETDLRCGAHEPYDRTERNRLIKTDDSPCQFHNNCSGKHAGMLTWTRHAKAGPEYVEPDHPLQRAIREAFEATTGAPSPGFGIDGCSAPNFACTVAGLGRAMAYFAAAPADGSARDRAAHRLTRAMAAFPEMVAGEGRACTILMREMGGRVAIKTGAEAVFVAIVPEKRLGIALKIEDGNSRASEAAIAALLHHVGVLSETAARRYTAAAQINCRGLHAAEMRLAPGFPAA